MRVWPIVVVGASGCLFPSLSDLDDGLLDATSDVASEVAPVDVQTNDVVDASSDTGDAAVESGPFCESGAANVLLCDDFDDSDASTFGKWTSSVGALVRDPGAFTTAPFSLMATTPAQLDAAAPNPSSRLRRTFVQPLNHVTHTFDVRVDTYDTIGNKAFLNMLVITSGGIDVQYRISATATTLLYEVHIPTGQDAASTSTQFSLTPWTPGVWHRVVADITLTSVPAKLTVTVDGNVAVGPNAPASVAAFGAGQSMDVQAGVYYATTPETGWAVHTDNILLQAQ